MDPVKKETPVAINADQTLIQETGGIPGADHPGQIDAARKDIAGNLGVHPNEVIPDSEAAEKGLEETKKADFLNQVAGVQEEVAPNRPKTSDASLDLNQLGEHLNAFSPIGGDDDENIRTASSGQFSDLVEKRKAA